MTSAQLLPGARSAQTLTATSALFGALVAGSIAGFIASAQTAGPGSTPAQSRSAPSPPGHGHVHGQAQLHLTLDGGTLRIEAELPMEALTGFERAPRNDAERERLTRVLAALRAQHLFRPSDAAGCRHLGQQQRWAGATDGELPGDDGHTDLLLRHEFACTHPARLTAIETGLFDALGRLHRIEARFAGPAGSQARTLQRGHRVLELVR